MAVPDLLRALLTAAGPSGYEGAPAAAWREAAAAFAEVTADTLGSSMARVPGGAGAPPVIVTGHIDEIGLMVSHVDDDGFLRFLGVGGWDAQILVGQRVLVCTREGQVPGVIGKKPIHLLDDDQRKKVAELKDLHIDIGAKGAEEARAMVRVGDVAVLAADPLELPNERLVSRSLDNRIGAYVALEVARLVAEAGGAPVDLVAVANVQEETTFAGARTTAFALDPRAAIVVEVTHATDAPGIDPKELGHHPLGSGPVLERGSMLSPQLFELLHETAEAESIPFSVEAAAMRTGTDADAIHLSRAGIPTAVVSVPTRYMHSPVEMVSLDDVAATARLIAATVRRLGPDLSFQR